jgi:hypothetical protein
MKTKKELAMFRNIIAVAVLGMFVLMGGCSGGSSGGGGGGAGGGGTGTNGSGAATGTPYDMGTPTLSELYVSSTGNDANSGTEIGAPLRTLTAAWNMIPAGTLSATGFRINMIAGTYPCDADESACSNYFADKIGTYQFPIIIRSIDSVGAESIGGAIIRGGMDINNVAYLYLIGLTMLAGNDLPTNNSGNNVLHIANVDHMLMRNLVLTGPSGRTDTTSNIQEVLKGNQGSDVYLESSDVSGTFQTVVDLFSVQNGHFINNNIHGSGGRCAYLKGGSAYFRVEGNSFYDCHEAGFQAGEGSNFNLMRTPWLHYEAYDIKVVNNVIHDIYGAGLSVSGGYNILMAYNTLYRIGMSDTRDWTLAQFVLGSRSCTIVDEYPSAGAASTRCQQYIDAGGWGTASAGNAGETGGEWIPDKNIYVYNNIFYNPAGVSTAIAHFAVNGPTTLPADAKNIPNPAQTDQNLVIRGNIVWNGSGLELLSTTNGTAPGCADTNPTCNSTQLGADNAINTIEPQLTNPAGGDFTTTSGSNVLAATAYSIPDFTWDAFTPAVTQGTLSNSVTTNRAGAARTGADHPGAF